MIHSSSIDYLMSETLDARFVCLFSAIVSSGLILMKLGNCDSFFNCNDQLLPKVISDLREQQTDLWNEQSVFSYAQVTIMN